MPELALALLTTWFGPDLDDEAAVCAHASRWFAADPAFDDELRTRFAHHLVPAAAGAYRHWEATPRGALALVVLLDQISRNVHRDDPRSFSQDAAAREICRRALAVGHDRRLGLPQRGVLYMPLMHSESLEDHAEALARFEALAVVARGRPYQDLAERTLDYQRQHTADLARFGRYPYRNAVLGRVSTPEERTWLESRAGS